MGEGGPRGGQRDTNKKDLTCVADFGDGGGGQEQRNAGGSQKLERARDRAPPGFQKEHSPANTLTSAQ